MKGNNTERRKELICDLLMELKKTCLEIRHMSGEMSDSTDIYMKKVYDEHHDEIMTLVDEYNDRIHQVEEITRKITARMNDWFAFTNNEENLMEILFPIRFVLEKKSVRVFIKQSREQISDLVIKNRFAREKIKTMEEQLRQRTVLKIEQESEYRHFGECMRKKDEITGHLSYLMPTVHQLCPIQYTAEGTDDLVLRLSRA